ncbi:hypothetical protein D3C84_1297690 [compost metagenome]
MERFTIGIVQAHEDFVCFENFDPHHFFGLVLIWQVVQAFRTWHGLVNDVEHLLEAHRL